MLRQRIVRLLSIAGLLGAVALTGCDDSVLPQVGCASDDDCRVGRLCEAGVCVDPDGTAVDGGADTGGGDVRFPDTTQDADAGSDSTLDVQIPDIPPAERCATASPESLTLGPIEAGGVISAPVTLENCGAGALTLEELAFQTDSPSALSLRGTPQLPQTLAPGETIAVLVEGFGVGDGLYSGTIVARWEGLETITEVTLDVTGDVPPPACVEATPRVDFGELDEGELSERAVVWSNCGEQPVVITDIGLAGERPDAFAFEPRDVIELGAGESFELPVLFAPPSCDARFDAQLVAQTSADVTVRTVLTGSCGTVTTEACVEVDSDRIDFGDLPLGEVAERSIVLRNCGEVDLAFEPPTLEPATRTFAVGDSPALLLPGESSEILVTARGAVPGPATALITITETEGAVAPTAIGLAVSVVDDPPDESCLSFDPNPLNFGEVPAGREARRAVVVENCGATDAVLSRGAVEGDRGFGFVIPDDPLVGPGDTRELVLLFAADPDAPAGPRSGSFFVELTDGTPAELLLGAEVIREDVPSVCIEPAESDTLEFGEVEVGAAALGEIGFFNCGDDEVTITGVSFLRGDRDSFDASRRPITVEPGQTFFVDAEFVPAGPGATSALFTFSLADGTSDGLITLSGTGIEDDPVERCLGFSREAIDFGTNRIGDRAIESEATIRNCGDTPIDGIRATLEGDPVFSTRGLPDAGFELAPGEERAFVVSMSRARAGGFEGVLVATGAGETATLRLAGTVRDAEPTPCLEAERELLSFGEVEVGEAASQTLIVSNCGDTVLALERPRIITPIRSFTAEPNEPIELGPGDVFEYLVSFAPTDEEERSAELVITSAEGLEVVVNLTGRGTIARLGPTLVLDPTRIAFGEVANGERVSRPVSICNGGDAPLLIESIVFRTRTRVFVTEDAASGEIAPDECTELAVTFAPIDVADGETERFSNAILVETNDRDGRVGRVELVGVGVGDEPPPPACFAADRDIIEFGEVLVGEQSAGAVRLVNCGETALQLGDAGIEQERPASFFVRDGAPPAGTSIPPGESFLYPLLFEPADARDFAGALVVFAFSESGEELVAETRLVGTGVEDAPVACVRALDERIVFPTTGVGAESADIIRIENCGSGVVRREELVISRGDFVFDGDGPDAIEPGDTGVYPVLFRPRTPGALTAIATITFDSGLEATVELSGRATGETPDGPQITVRPSRLDFGRVQVGAAATRAVQVCNVGDERLVVDSIRAERRTDLFSILVETPLRIDADTCREVPVVFRPAGLRPGGELAYEDGLRIVSNDADDNVVRVEMLAVGFAPEDDETCVTTDIEVVEFGRIALGETAVRPVRFANCGETDVEVESLLVDGEGDFRLVAADRSPLEPGAVRQFRIRFGPTEVGPRAGLMVARFSGGFDFEISLVGEGIDDGTPTGPLIRVEPTRVNFGEVAVGDERTRTVRVCNDGDETLEIFEVETIDFSPAFRAVGWSTEPIEPGECRLPVVVFAPTDVPPGEERVFRALAALTTNDPTTEVARIGFSGVGISEGGDEPCLRALTEGVDFGSINVGETVERSVRFENCGETEITVGEAAVSTADSPVDLFTLADQVPGGGATLAPGDEVTVFVSITGTVPGEYTGTVELPSDEAGAAAAAVRAQVQTDPDIFCLRASPDAVALGEVTLGVPQTATVRLVNCGTIPIPVLSADVDNTEGEGFRVLPGGFPSLVGSGDTVELTVVFTGTSFGDYEAELTFNALAPGIDTPVVRLTARVPELGGDTTCVEAEPEEVALGTLTEGEATEFGVVIRNCGSTPVILLSASLRREGTGYSIESTGGFLPFPLTAGAERELTLSFTATEPGPARNQLVVQTSDSDSPNLTVPLSALVEEATVCPSLDAGASVDPGGPFVPALESSSGETVFLDAGLDSDVDAEILWEALEAPTDTLPPIADTVIPGRVSTTLDTPGDYLFSVQFETADGCADEALVQVSVTDDSSVGEGIRVVVTWRTPGDDDEFADPGSDVDLHFVRVTRVGATWDRAPNDTYYANRTPDWGVAGDTSDDPELLRDELNGLGPEIVVLEQPEPGRRYLVGVHYWDDKEFGPSIATVRIFIDGEELEVLTRTLNEADDFWLAAEIRDGGDTVEVFDFENFEGFPPADVP